jgi:hypothetical protein
MRPKISVVVCFFDMQREAPRTLHSLSPAYQRGVVPAEYEVIAVENGSRKRLPATLVESFGENFHYSYFETASPSPVEAINHGVASAAGELVAICIDGARLLSPGVLTWMLRAARLHPEPFIATLSFHLGPDAQARSMLAGYDQTAEDELLSNVPWRQDGYRLFEIAAFAESSRYGWFEPLIESNCYALSRRLFDELAGLDARFQAPGGGLANHDFLRRACQRPDVEPIVLLGEGTFHQFHGGVATNTASDTWPDFHADYVQIRGVPYEPVKRTPSLVGHMPTETFRFLAQSLEMALEASRR